MLANYFGITKAELVEDSQIRHHILLQPCLRVYKRGRRPFEDQFPIIHRPGQVVMPMSAPGVRALRGPCSGRSYCGRSFFSSADRCAHAHTDFKYDWIASTAVLAMLLLALLFGGWSCLVYICPNRIIVQHEKNRAARNGRPGSIMPCSVYAASLAHVIGPTIPSSSKPCAAWKFRTAVSVSAPKPPSSPPE